MVTQQIGCYHCGSENIVKNGIAPNGKQKYRCKDCREQSRKQASANGYPEGRREEILRAYEERSSLRGLSRTFGVARNTVSRWLKKTTTLPALKDTLAPPDKPKSAVLELDELWSFIHHKANKRWTWLALCK